MADENRASVSLSHVNPALCWLRGAAAAKAILQEDNAESEEGALFGDAEVDWQSLARDGIDMFKPNGE